MKKRLLIALAAMSVALGSAEAAAAATRYVATTGNDVANNCTVMLMPCMTIQHAIDVANPGDTISVAPGVYPEPAPAPLNVYKSVTLVGAQAGVDARSPRGPESDVVDPQGTYVTASNVIVNGFTFENSVSPYLGYGIAMGPGTSGTQILNNIVRNNIAGIGLGGSQVLIVHNQVQTNNAPGAASGTGIYTDEFVGGSTENAITVFENAFIGNDDAGIDISNTDASGGVFRLTVEANSFDANGRGVVFFNTHDSLVQHNTITNSTFVGSAAIRLFDNNTNLSILRNDLSTGTGHAIRFSFLGFVGGPSSGVVIHQNNIGVVGPTSFVLDGLLVDPGSHNGTVDATCNWWGSPTGPINPNNPGGMGEEVVGDAHFEPWLVAPAPGGPCAGSSAPTPGKVTGGGQVEGDPLFSPLGELISIPAIVPSVTGGQSNATFGFSVRCCPAAGNLQYNDHGADTRIKAESIDGLFISSPGVSCPAVPGSKHARFTGMAAVTGPAGTTHERFTADADDCGEPGTADAFGIQTETYDKPQSTLVGGNIQIHKS